VLLPRSGEESKRQKYDGNGNAIPHPLIAPPLDDQQIS